MRLSERMTLAQDPVFLSRVKAAILTVAVADSVNATAAENVAHSKQIQSAPDYYSDLYANMAVNHAQTEFLAPDTEAGDAALLDLIRTELYPSFTRPIFDEISAPVEIVEI